MTVRFYLMPAVIETVDDQLMKHPKYDTLWAGQSFHVVDYGREGFFLCGVDVTPAQHTAISANADVASFPADLATTIGAGALTAITNALETRFIPANGVTTATTYLQLLRRIFLACQLAQRLEGKTSTMFPNATATLFSGGTTLDSTWASLSVQKKAVMVETFSSFGFDASLLTAASTIRQILLAFGQQWQAGAIDVLGTRI